MTTVISNSVQRYQHVDDSNDFASTSVLYFQWRSIEYSIRQWGLVDQGSWVMCNPGGIVGCGQYEIHDSITEICHN